ncbi:MAG: DctP family TRAP transporter solute-binding subunit [Synergistaceae bacterium]|jgi:tripartite ATP-independent transporter DctP family solute receptor|nr:DctP family TRAP transporter solute-binding subunit [Synergistaceae bacterium]
MKRLSVLLLVLSLLFLTAAGSEAAAKYKIKIHSVGNEEHASTPALKEFKKHVEEKTKGDVEVSLHLNASLAGDREATEAMQLGTIEAGIIGSSILATFEPSFNIFEFPFLFKDDATAKKLIDGELGEKLNAAIQKQDLRIIGYGVNGFRHTTNNRGPIKKPSDMNGLKIRTMENPIHIATFKLFGANPTPINFGELYTALSQKTVDAMECPLNLIYTPKFYEVQKYLSLTGHLYAVAPLTMSEIFFRSLPDEYKEIIIEGGKIYTEIQRKNTIADENNMLKLLEEAGMIVNDLTEAEKNEFKKLSAPVYDQFADKVGRDFLNEVIEANK